MGRSREELRRGIRALIQETRQQMDELESGRAPAAKPILPSPQDVSSGSLPLDLAEQGEAARLRNVRYLRDREQTTSPEPVLEVSHYDPRKGVCPAFFVNARCWELPDAYCNHALHVCMLRNCPIYHLHREELERRFASRFRHLW